MNDKTPKLIDFILIYWDDTNPSPAFSYRLGNPNPITRALGINLPEDKPSKDPIFITLPDDLYNKMLPALRLQGCKNPRKQVEILPIYEDNP